LLKNANPDDDLKIGRLLTLVLLLLSMCTAPLVAEMGGIFTFLQTILSLFQGPMLALLILGAFTRRATPQAGLWTLISGVVVASATSYAGVNMLYVAFSSFIYALCALWLLSGFTAPHSEKDLSKLTYVLWRRN
jgi:SSS family solute:Na+ symporter